MSERKGMTMKRKRPHRLEEYLFQHHLTPAQVAAAAAGKGHKLSMPTVYSLIHGTSHGSRRTRYALAAALGETVEKIDALLKS